MSEIISMTRADLDARIDVAMADGVIDTREIRSIVAAALSDGVIDPSELVIARNSLKAAERELDEKLFRLDRAQGRVEQSAGGPNAGNAVAARDLVQSDVTRARNQVEGLRTINEIFKRHADGPSRVFGGIFNGVGDILRGGRDFIHDVTR
jgi:hypothetical protein